jgi:hypothetical protein
MRASGARCPPRKSAPTCTRITLENLALGRAAIALDWPDTGRGGQLMELGVHAGKWSAYAETCTRITLELLKVRT